MNAIEVKDLCKEYPGFTLDHVSLTLPSGCILGLVGENGAGKSTMIRLMLGLIRKNGGSISLLGSEAGDVNASVRDDIGVVLDNVGLPHRIKTKEIGKIMAKAFSRWDQAAYEGYLQRFRIPQDKRFMEMSNGTKMKLGLAIALSHNAKLLILDEATNGLDPVARDDVNSILMEFTRDENHSILISSHIVGDLEKLCDYIAFLHKGKLLLCEEKDVLASEYVVVRGTKEELNELPSSAVLHKETTPYSAAAIARREAVPEGMTVSPVSIEELFVSMVKSESYDNTLL